jgi:hypothetical protein
MSHKRMFPKVDPYMDGFKHAAGDVIATTVKLLREDGNLAFYLAELDGEMQILHFTKRLTPAQKGRLDGLWWAINRVSEGLGEEAFEEGA